MACQSFVKKKSITYLSIQNTIYKSEEKCLSLN